MHSALHCGAPASSRPTAAWASWDPASKQSQERQKPTAEIIAIEYSQGTTLSPRAPRNRAHPRAFPVVRVRAPHTPPRSDHGRFGHRVHTPRLRQSRVSDPHLINYYVSAFLVTLKPSLRSIYFEMQLQPVPLSDPACLSFNFQSWGLCIQ